MTNGTIPIGFDETELQIIFRTVQLVLSITTVAIGGLLATYFWRRITRPDLNIPTEPITIVPSSSGSNTFLYRVDINNEGRRVAKNCKAKLNYSVNKEEKTYRISATERWAEHNNPTRININAGETAQFDLFKYNESDGTITFPSSDKKNSESLVYEEIDSQSDFLQSANANIAVNSSVLTSGQIKKNSIKVTSENAESIDATIAITEDNNGHIDTEIN